jgi:hypothetical protein
MRPRKAIGIQARDDLWGDPLAHLASGDPSLQSFILTRLPRVRVRPKAFLERLRIFSRIGLPPSVPIPAAQ